MSVTLLRAYGQNNAGDVLTLSADTETSLIQQGIATRAATNFPSVVANAPFEAIESPQQAAQAAAYGQALPVNPLGAAQRVLRAAAKGITPIDTVMGTPPTLTQAASDGANSTVITTATVAAGGGTYNSENPAHVTLLGAPSHANGGISGNRLQVITRQNGARIPGHGSGIGFQTYASTLDMCIRSNGGGKPIVYVTDPTGLRARIQALDIVPTFTSPNYYKLDWGGVRALRTYEWYSTGANLASYFGINVPTTDSIWPIDLNQPRVLVIGDSFIEGSMNDSTLNAKMGVASWYGAYLGCQNPIGNGVGSTGIQATAGASNYNNFMGRLLAGDFDQARIGNMDLVLVYGSINDYNVTNGGVSDDNAFAAIATAFYQAIAAKQPNALIVACGPEYPNLGPPTQARYDATKAAFANAAGGDPRFLYLDNSQTAERWTFGNSATGNNTQFIGADNIHPNSLVGARYHGFRAAQSTIAAIRRAYPGL